MAEATVVNVACPRPRKRGAARSISEVNPLATQSSAIAMPRRPKCPTSAQIRGATAAGGKSPRSTKGNPAQRRRI
eukprot:7321495-Alexandrium_andersonii.AAC.1